MGHLCDRRGRPAGEEGARGAGRAGRARRVLRRGRQAGHGARLQLLRPRAQGAALAARL